jgi:uncharacterized protein YbaP (TraB family)
LKKTFLLPLLLVSLFLQAQKDNSLFWEISGNGLQKKSYLYGTMHVNDKVSYHLSDSFFKNLMAADMVANESNPETWNDVVEFLEEKKETPTYNFYSEFYLFPIKKERIINVFSNSNYFNSMLSGIEGQQADFQESTVLDMFIFQTGKKYGKKNVGLESAKGSVLPLLTMTAEDVTPPEENRAVLMKMVKNKNFIEAIKQYYREKDIVMLDSLYRLALSKKAHNLLITSRNAIMVNSLDSLARKGSVFSAVGAAHLAGTDGIINLLRQKGYTVTPIMDSFTDNGKDKKKAIEEFFPNPGFETDDRYDGVIKVPLLKKRIRRNNDVASLDFANGGVTSVKRLPLNDFINKNGEKFNPKTLDSLLFENIPGNIIEKKYSEQSNAHIYDVKNTTKSGNAQHYRFYVTPLELIAVSMIGSGNYVRQYENAVFGGIKIKPFGDAWETVAPGKGGFSVSVPTFNLAYGTDLQQTDDIEIQAFDDTEKGYYFLNEKTLSDTSILEDTQYEHRQIHFQFYHQQELDSAKTGFDKDRLVFHSQSADGKIKLKTFIRGQKYYLLGTVSASDKNADRFFDSFAFAPFHYSENTKTFSDPETGYKIDLPEKHNSRQFLNIGGSGKKDENIFDAKYRYLTFHSDAGKTVSLVARHYNKYHFETSLDSIRQDFRKTFIKYDQTNDYYDEYDDDEYYGTTSLLSPDVNERKGFSKSKWKDEIKLPQEEKYNLISENESFDKEKNIRTFTATVGKMGSTQIIRYKVLFREDGSLTLSTLLDKKDAPDAFIEKAFSSLDFVGNSKSSVFEKNKIKLFIADAQSDQDTIRSSAMNSAYYLDIAKDDFDDVADFVDTFVFTDEETTAKITLLEKIGELEDGRVIPFLEKFYKQPDAGAEMQLSVLRALTYQKSKAAYNKIGELMKSDLPLSDDQYSISSLFVLFKDDLQNSKELFPTVFKFYNTDEYKAPVISFCNSMFDKGLLTAKSMKPYKEIILDNANVKAKRFASKSKPLESDYEAIPDFSNMDQVGELIDYAKLFYNLPQDKETNAFFTKLKALDNAQINMELLRLAMINNRLTDADIADALKNEQTRYATIQLLLNNKKPLPETLSDDDIAKSAVINFNNLDEKVPVTMLEKRTIPFKGANATFYFFKGEVKNTETLITDTQLYPIAFINENSKIKPLAYKVFYTRYNVAEDELSEKYNSIIQAAQDEDHPRSSFEKLEQVEPVPTSFE